MTRSAFSSRNFRIYLLGSIISLHGLWIYRLALGWYAWELSQSEFWVGVVAFTQFAPAVIFGPIFGVLADRFDRLRASIIINLGSAANMACLGLLAYFGKADIGVLVALSLVQGALDGAHTPVRMTLLPNVVEKNQLQSAIASTSIAFNVSRFIGPAISGLLIATFGVSTAFFVNGVSYFAYIVALLVIELRPAAVRSKVPDNVWQELLQGIRYVLSHRTIRGLLIVAAVASVFGRGALEMMPAIADKVFGQGSSGLAILMAAVGVGAVSTGLVLARNSDWLNSKIVKRAVVVAGFMIAGFGYVDTLYAALPIVVGLGIILSLCGVGSQILIQTMVEDEVRGRVTSFWGMIAFGGTALGSLLVGSLATVFGLQQTVIFSGLLCAAVAMLAPIGNDD